jgi:hypothetical protein
LDKIHWKPEVTVDETTYLAEERNRPEGPDLDVDEDIKCFEITRDG